MNLKNEKKKEKQKRQLLVITEWQLEQCRYIKCEKMVHRIILQRALVD